MVYRNRWKDTERQVAKMLGVTRNPNDGTHKPDIDYGPFNIEHKCRSSVPKWFSKAMTQAVRASQENTTPVLVISVPQQGVGTERYAVMRFKDWLDWHGPSERSE